MEPNSGKREEEGVCAFFICAREVPRMATASIVCMIFTHIGHSKPNG